MTTRPCSKRRAPRTGRTRACVGQTAGRGEGVTPCASRSGTSRGSHLEVLYILFQSPVSRVCSLPSLSRSPLRAWLYLRAPRFRRGLGSEVSQDQFGGLLLARWRPLRVGLTHQPSPTLPTATASAQPSPHSS